MATAPLTIPGLDGDFHKFRNPALQAAFDHALENLAPSESKEVEFHLQTTSSAKGKTDVGAYIVGAQRIGKQWTLTEVLGVKWLADEHKVDPEVGFRLRWAV